MNTAADIWFEFCADHGVGAHPVPLFATEDGRVGLIRFRKGHVLQRSDEMEELVSREVALVLADFKQGSDQVDGLIYCMYTLDPNGRPEPRYIGKAEKYGKRGGNISVNLKNVEPGRVSSYFARWGYGHAYHMGDLSRVVVDDDSNAPAKYQRWADALFVSPVTSRVLKMPVYFWCKAWRSGAVGPWKDFGPTSLTFLEYLLIGIGSSAFPCLLNAEGKNRASN